MMVGVKLNSLPQSQTRTAMEKLPTPYELPTPKRRASKGPRRLLGLVIAACIAQGIFIFSHGFFSSPLSHSTPSPEVQAHRSSLIAKCHDIHTPAGPPASFSTADRVKSGSDRWVLGTPPTLLKNAKIWTGARNGTEVVFGDILLDRGLIVAVGYIPPNLLETTRVKNGGTDIRIMDVGGKWITPGLVDLHSHIGVHSSPGLIGAITSEICFYFTDTSEQGHLTEILEKPLFFLGFEVSTA